MISRLLSVCLTGLFLPLAPLAAAAPVAAADTHGIEIAPPSATPSPLAAAFVAEAAAPAPAPFRAGSFQGINREDQSSELFQSAWPPSPVLGVGPDHVVEVMNQSMAVYTRGGSRISHVRLTNFLRVTKGNIIYQSQFDPKIVYDIPTGRWFMACSAVAAGSSTSAVKDPYILAVSATADPTASWNTYLLDVGVPAVAGVTHTSGNLTLGVDGNGVYLGLRFFPSTGTQFNKIVAIRKSTLTAAKPSLGKVYQFSNLLGSMSSPVPVTNFAKIAGSDPAWFISSINAVRANVRLWKITWGTTAPTLSAPVTVTTPAYADAMDIPHRGGTALMDITDERIQTAVLSRGHLWTCRTIGTNAAGTATTPNRTGCEWLDISLSGPEPVLVQSGRIHDTSATSPRSYCFPALGVNDRGHVLMSFMGMSVSDYMSVYFTGREDGDLPGTMDSVQLLKAGGAPYNKLVNGTILANGRCGSVCVDPVDRFTLWTVQSYAHAATLADTWGTWIASIGFPNPPGTIAVSPTSINFGKVRARSTKSVSFTIASKGVHPLKLAVKSPGAPFAIVSGGGTYSLSGGKKKTVTVKFKPTAAIKKSGSIKITTNDPARPTITIKLSGTGTK